MPTNTAKQDPLIHLFGMLSRGTDRYIKEQEAEGQSQVSADKSDGSTQVRLPVPQSSNIRQEYESLGIEFLDPVDGDPIFVYATLPAGWSIRPTSHSMHNNIFDALENHRASFFYKAAFYDRNAHLYSPHRRYIVQENSLDEQDVYERCDLVRIRVVDRLLSQPLELALDEALETQYRLAQASSEEVLRLRAEIAANALYQVEERVGLPRPNGFDDRLAWWDRHTALVTEKNQQCKAWLTENFPDYENPAAYWPK